MALFIKAPDRSSCPIRGRAMPAFTPGVEIMAAPEWTRDQILGIVAHEVAHVLNVLDSDLPLAPAALLHQGLASWGAGRYWANMLGFETLSDVVRDYRENGSYIALGDSDEALILAFPQQPQTQARSTHNCLAVRDTLYTEWAAFIDYLMISRGRDRFIALLEAPAQAGDMPGPDYEHVYGMSLSALESEWLATL
jgi:hypothetical protein